MAAEERIDKLDYRDKVILAPMVRIGTLPTRLLALRYGADIVYTEELIDWKLLRTVRKVNDILGTVDFIDKADGTVVFRTCPLEKGRVVLQVGTSSPERALQVGKLVENDVAAIDVNMGCPKKFSLLGGMGAALLKAPDKAVAILTTLVNGLKIPVTCKIRVMPDVDQTLELCKKLEATGIAAIGVHGRTVQERPQHPNRLETLKRIAETLTIPVIANGGGKEIEKYKDIAEFKKASGCSSVMIARAAEWNCSIFSKDGLVDMQDIITEHLKLAIDYDNPPSNTKYCIQNILRELQETPLGRKFLNAQTMEQICECWDMAEYCQSKAKEYRDMGYTGRFHVNPSAAKEEGGDMPSKKSKNFDSDAIVMRCAFIRSNYSENLADWPKTKLFKWAADNNKESPAYETWNEDKLFRSVVTIDGQKYSSSFWEKKKKWAEHGAALVCLCHLGLIDKDTLIKGGNILD